MTSYLVMIYDNEAKWEAADDGVAQENHRRHGAFAAANGGALRGGARLGGSETATSIRRTEDGVVTVTDGTFTETKEVMGGYYVIEAADLDEALEIAKQVPAPMGGVEVRPIIQS
ncbi:YciI family protein [Plantactinospora sp. GCM10030261]|uniref:YciI family protein n=1 Tax=Plantactinospora sp. GCM10030261 TaxID=3273420 RepID=UPI00361DDEB7